MSGSLRILFMAMAMLLLFSVVFAQDYDDCKQACEATRDTRNMDCPSPYDAPSAAGLERRQCIENNQAAYKECIKQCPAQSSSSGEPVAPPAMGY